MIILLVEVFLMLVPVGVGMWLSHSLTFAGVTFWEFFAIVSYVSLLCYGVGLLVFQGEYAPYALGGPALGVFAGVNIWLGLIVSAPLALAGCVAWAVSARFVLIGTDKSCETWELPFRRYF